MTVMSSKDITVNQLRKLGCHQLAGLVEYNDGLYHELINFSGSKPCRELAYQNTKNKE